MTLTEHIADLQREAADLSPSGRALVAAQLKADLIRLKPSVAVQGGKRNAARTAAELMRVSVGSIFRADELLRLANDELIERVRSGELGLSAALRLISEVDRPGLDELRRCWRLCSPTERQEFLETINHA